jgi:hypothetical protein
MTTYLCQIPEQDHKDAWEKVEAYRADWAAEQYAERRDDDSAGQLFEDFGDTAIVLVKIEGSDEPPKRFKVGFDYTKTFGADEEPAQESALPTPSSVAA